MCLDAAPARAGWLQRRRSPNRIHGDAAQLENVSFKQRLDEKLPLDAASRTTRPLRDARPVFGETVLLAFVYYQCPMLCTQVMNGISSRAEGDAVCAGRDFDVLISFDLATHRRSPRKKRKHLDWSTEREAALAPADRRRGLDSPRDVGGRLFVSMGRTDGTVRARERHPHRHA
jgi:hypothetical protein